MDIKTSPQQVRRTDHPADMRRNLNAACRFIVVHGLMLFSSVRRKSQCRQEWRTGFTTLIIASFAPSLSLIIRE